MQCSCNEITSSCLRLCHLVKAYVNYTRRKNFFLSMENPIVPVQQGQLRGVYQYTLYGTKLIAFKGIPYAKPPVGELRFKDPEPVGPWSGIKDATCFGNKCPQRDWMSKQIIGDEDCLYLNIYTKDLNASIPRPVMIWIHGGAFVYGSGNDDIYGPDYLMEKDIVLVTINYRVGILGFLNVDDEIASGNQGLKDQVLALKWIQHNIARFGGDDNNVTIFGESAGSASVHYLSVSPLAQGLFHKAILQSGVAVNPWASALHSTEEIVKRLSAALGNETTDPKVLVQFLKTIDIHRLIELATSLQTWQDKIRFIQPFGPTVDTKSKNPFLSIPIQNAAKAGVRVPCMFGYLSHEGIIFVTEYGEDKYHHIDSDPENLLIHPTIKKLLSDRNVTVQDMRRIFVGNEKIEPNTAQKLVDLQSAVHITMGIHQMLEVQARITHVPTYLYKFELESLEPVVQKVFGSELKGTCHAEELRYLFSSTMFEQQPAEPNSAEDLLIRRFVELWTNFAKTGYPTVHTSDLISIDWKPINGVIEYDCLQISENPRIIKEINILHQIDENMKKNKL